MVGNRVDHRSLINIFRRFHRSLIFRESKSAETSSAVHKDVGKKEKENQIVSSILRPGNPLGPDMYKIKPFDKWLLVWHKQYKSTEEVPAFVREELIDRIHSKTRIQVATILMILTLFGCAWCVWSGKKEAGMGNTIDRRITDKHKKLREEYLASLEKQSK